MDNFEELKKKVEENPNSSLFVPLAEEYRKRDQLDEAVGVLKAGLERQPGYMSAHVALARIYLSKDMTKEAIEELEQVAAVAPDNLFAHKKLAEAYCMVGRLDEAAGQYRVVLELNPGDEAAAEGLSKIISGEICAPTEDDTDAPAKDDLDATMVMKKSSAKKPVKKAPPENADKTMVMEAPAFAKKKPAQKAAAEDDFDGTMVMKKSPSKKPVKKAPPADAGKTTIMQAPDFAGDTDEYDVFPDASPDASTEVASPEAELPEAASLETEGIEVFDGVEDYEADVSDGYDIGGLEYEPDGVYVDDESQMVERVEEAGLDIGVDVAYASDEEPPAASGVPDILAASETAGRDILDDGVGGEYSRESLVAGEQADMQVEAAPGLETFEQQDDSPSDIGSQDQTMVMREPLAGMEESLQEDAAETAPEDKTVIMESPFAASPTEPSSEQTMVMAEPIGGVPEEADKTVVMQAPFETDAAPEVAEADKTLVMAEPIGGVPEEADKTVVMQAPFVAEAAAVEAVEVAEADKTVVMAEPFVAEAEVVEAIEVADENQTVLVGGAPEQEAEAVEAIEVADENQTVLVGGAPEPETAAVFEAEEVLEEQILAEPGTITEESVAVEPEHLINDPMASMSPAPAPAGDAAASMNEELKDAMELAESHVTCGEYNLAMDVYNAMLTKYPEQEIIKLKVQELKMLLKVMGQDDMVYEQRLESFLKAIMRRKDELHETA